MEVVDAQQFLFDQLPVRQQTLIPPTLKNAYAAVEKLAAEEPILQVPSALDNRGRLIAWAVDLAFQKLIDSGRMNAEYVWRNYSKPTGRYLEIRLEHSVLTLSQVSTPHKQPRDAVFRENGRLNNQPFFDLEEFRDEYEVKGLPHLLLLHGHQSLNFAHLAVPNSEHSRGLTYTTQNLLKLPHEVPTEVAPVEHTSFEDLMTLKGEIERWRMDHE